MIVHLNSILFFFIVFFTFTYARTYQDDSLAVAEILSVNGLDSVAVSSVSSASLSDGGRIRSLYLDRLGLRILPECIGELDSLATLNISGNDLTELPQSIGKLSKLYFFSCYENRIFELPSTFCQLQELTTVYLFRNRFTSWPEVFYGMPNLEVIDLGSNHFTKLPDYIGECITLEKLYINDNFLTQLPERIKNIPLEVVHVAGNAICDPPTSIVNWLDLHDYYKENSKWRTYQYCDSYTNDVAKVSEFLKCNGWDNIPIDSVIIVENGNIVGIDVSAEKCGLFESLPERDTVLSQTLVFPSNMVYLKHLRSLNLSGNNIETLPSSTDSLCHLEKLDLSNNLLTALPDFMASFRNLSSLDLSGNQIINVSSKIEQWADTYSPEWRSKQIGSSSISGKKSQTKDLPLAVVVNSVRLSAIQVRFNKPLMADIAVFSVSGRLVKALGKKQFNEGVYNIIPDYQRLSKGTFLVVIKNGDIVIAAQKIVL